MCSNGSTVEEFRFIWGAKHDSPDLEDFHWKNAKLMGLESEKCSLCRYYVCHLIFVKIFEWFLMFRYPWYESRRGKNHECKALSVLLDLQHVFDVQVWLMNFRLHKTLGKKCKTKRNTTKCSSHNVKSATPFCNWELESLLFLILC